MIEVAIFHGVQNVDRPAVGHICDKIKWPLCDFFKFVVSKSQTAHWMTLLNQVISHIFVKRKTELFLISRYRNQMVDYMSIKDTTYIPVYYVKITLGKNGIYETNKKTRTVQ